MVGAPSKARASRIVRFPPFFFIYTSGCQRYTAVRRARIRLRGKTLPFGHRLSSRRRASFLKAALASSRRAWSWVYPATTDGFLPCVFQPFRLFYFFSSFSFSCFIFPSYPRKAPDSTLLAALFIARQKLVYHSVLYS